MVIGTYYYGSEVGEGRCAKRPSSLPFQRKLCELQARGTFLKFLQSRRHGATAEFWLYGRFRMMLTP